MIRSHEEDEFVAVRVQDPRVQNEGSWYSFVDYKIFLHTNSRAFTAKTSCVRRRYSEFVWLKKRLQKNAGLVPVPDLPRRSFFSFSNEDFLERRRRGLQVFLDKVLHLTVCLSDSQLHLFLQTQLPVGHILDCVQGHTPYTVTDAILTYASSNQGWAQAQEEDLSQEPSLNPVPYESMESPAPHLPAVQNKETANPVPHTSSDHGPLESTAVVHSADAAESNLSKAETPSLKVIQMDNHLEAFLESHSPAGATFYLGDGQDELAPDRSSPEDKTPPRSFRIQTPVQVHSPMGAGFEDKFETSSQKVTQEESGHATESCGLLDIEELIPVAQILYHGDFKKEDGEGDSLGTFAVAHSCHEVEVVERYLGSEEPVVEHVISSGKITYGVVSSDNSALKCTTSVRVCEHGVSSGEENAESKILQPDRLDEPVSEDNSVEAVEVVGLGGEILGQVYSVEPVLEHDHSSKNAPVHSPSEEQVVEHISCDALIQEHVSLDDSPLINPGEKVLEHISSKGHISEHCPSEHVLEEENGELVEQVISDEMVVELLPSEHQVCDYVVLEEEVQNSVEKQAPENAPFEEHTPEPVPSNGQVLNQVHSEKLIQEQHVLEYAPSQDLIVEHLDFEGESVEQDICDEKVVEHLPSVALEEEVQIQNSVEKQALENVPSEEHILELMFNEQVIKQVGPEKWIQEHENLEKDPSASVTSKGLALENVLSDEPVLEHRPAIEDSENADEQALKGISSDPQDKGCFQSEQHALEHDHSNEQASENAPSQERALEHLGIEGDVWDQVHADEKVEEHANIGGDVREQVRFDEQVLGYAFEEPLLKDGPSDKNGALEEQALIYVSSKEQALENVNFEGSVLQQVRFEGQTVEDFSSEAQEHVTSENDEDYVSISEQVPAVVSCSAQQNEEITSYKETFSSDIETAVYIKQSDDLVCLNEAEADSESSQKGNLSEPHATEVEKPGNGNIQEKCKLLDQNLTTERASAVKTCDVENSNMSPDDAVKMDSDNESKNDEEYGDDEGEENMIEQTNGYLETAPQEKHHKTDCLESQTLKQTSSIETPVQVRSSSGVEECKGEVTRIQAEEEKGISILFDPSSSDQSLQSCSQGSGHLIMDNELDAQRRKGVDESASDQCSEQVTLSEKYTEASEQNRESNLSEHTDENNQADSNDAES